MRIADRRATHVERFVTHGQVFAQHLSARPRHWDFIAPETDLAHVHLNRFAAVVNCRAHDTAERVHKKLLILTHKLLIEKVTAEDAQSIPAFLRLAAVGIENAQSKWGAA